MTAVFFVNTKLTAHNRLKLGARPLHVHADSQAAALETRAMQKEPPPPLAVQTIPHAQLRRTELVLSSSPDAGTA